MVGSERAGSSPLDHVHQGSRPLAVLVSLVLLISASPALPFAGAQGEGHGYLVFRNTLPIGPDLDVTFHVVVPAGVTVESASLDIYGTLGIVPVASDTQEAGTHDHSLQDNGTHAHPVEASGGHTHTVNISGEHDHPVSTYQNNSTLNDARMNVDIHSHSHTYDGVTRVVDSFDFSSITSNGHSHTAHSHDHATQIIQSGDHGHITEVDGGHDHPVIGSGDHLHTSSKNGLHSHELGPGWSRLSDGTRPEGVKVTITHDTTSNTLPGAHGSNDTDWHEMMGLTGYIGVGVTEVRLTSTTDGTLEYVLMVVVDSPYGVITGHGPLGDDGMLEVPIWGPPDTVSAQVILFGDDLPMSVDLASIAGNHTHTAEAGGGHDHSMGLVADHTHVVTGGAHEHNGTVDPASPDTTETTPTWNLPAHQHSVSWAGNTVTGLGAHSYGTMQSTDHNHKVNAHSHGTSLNVSGDHSHDLSRKDLHIHDVEASGVHSHEVNESAGHAHSLTYHPKSSDTGGPTGVRMFLDGLDITVINDGPWDLDDTPVVVDLDVASWELPHSLSMDAVTQGQVEWVVLLELIDPLLIASVHGMAGDILAHLPVPAAINGAKVGVLGNQYTMPLDPDTEVMGLHDHITTTDGNHIHDTSVGGAHSHELADAIHSHDASLEDVVVTVLEANGAVDLARHTHTIPLGSQFTSQNSIVGVTGTHTHGTEPHNHVLVWGTSGDHLHSCDMDGNHTHEIVVNGTHTHTMDGGEHSHLIMPGVNHDSSCPYLANVDLRLGTSPTVYLDGNTSNWWEEFTVDRQYLTSPDMKTLVGSSGTLGTFSAVVWFMLENDPPTFGPDHTTRPVTKGLDITFTIDVYDDLRVEEVFVVFGYGNEVPSNMSMAGLPRASLIIAVPRYPSGPLHYAFYAKDSSGNWNSTGETTCEVINTPPTILPIPQWNVTEEDNETFDLTAFIQDLNDPLSNLEMTCEASNITVEGFTMYSRFDTWVPDHVAKVTFTDGEDTIDANVNIHVININDPPIFTSTPMLNGTVNQTYRYQVEFFDEDPFNTHTFGLSTAPDGMTISTDGLIAWTPSRSQHDIHTVNLSLFDGYVTIYQEWAILVTPDHIDPLNLPPFVTNVPRKNATAGELFSWIAEAEDPDGDSLYFHLLEGPPGARIDNVSGELTWMPLHDKKDISIDIPFKIEVTDGQHKVPLSFIVRLRYPPNQPPKIQGRIKDISTDGEVKVDLISYMGDPDDPKTNLTWKYQDGDEDLFLVRFEGNTLVIVPREGAEGKASLMLVLGDPSGATDEQSIVVEVTSWYVSNTTCLISILLVIIMAVLSLVYLWKWRGSTHSIDDIDEVEVETGTIDPILVVDVEETHEKDLDVDIDQIVGELDEDIAIEVIPVAAPVIIPAGSHVEGPLGYIVEQLYVVYFDGRLIAQCSREECRTKDADLMSGMLIAIQGFIQDGLESGGLLESIKYGDNNILMASGNHVILAAVIFGNLDETLKETLETMVQRIQGTYAGVIEDWNGDLSVLSGIEALIAPILAKTAHLIREDVGGTAVTYGVSLISAVDFHRGSVRLKVAAVNNTEELVADASIEVEYNPDMLRLERIEPPSLRLRGDRVTLGNIKPGEKATVAFIFDPQICQETHIDGSLTYFDAKGVRYRREMKRRQADVVCPIFFTAENANTAMLRRLIKEKLHMSDLRIFRYPKAIPPVEVLKIGKLALGGENIQLVREYIIEGPPFEAETWYFGETKVKGYQIVMRLGVIQEKGALEFFAASTAMKPITGLLAEFRRDLNRVLREKYIGDIRMEPERDEGVRRDLRNRPLLIDRVDEGEIEAEET